jgi:hypothetical protein
MRLKLAAIALGLTLLASGALLLAPAGTETTDGQSIHVTLRQLNGDRVIGVLLVPVLIALVPFLSERRAAATAPALLMCGFVVIAMSVGVFYLPAAAVMLINGLRREGAAGRRA